MKACCNRSRLLGCILIIIGLASLGGQEPVKLQTHSHDNPLPPPGYAFLLFADEPPLVCSVDGPFNLVYYDLGEQAVCGCLNDGGPGGPGGEHFAWLDLYNVNHATGHCE